MKNSLLVFIRCLQDKIAPRLSAHPEIIDVGASLGAFSLFFAQYAKIIHAFEPNSSIRSVLMENIRLSDWKNIYVHPEALSDRAGYADFYIKTQSGLSGLGDTGRGTTTHKETVPMSTLDSFHFRPDFIKIDVEGFEEEVLRGAQQTISSLHPFILCEVTEKNLLPLGKNRETILSLMSVYHYTYLSLGQDLLFLPRQ